MKYDKARVGGRPSATQWNGFLDMHRSLYANNANNAPLPPLLSNSVIASASLEASSDDIAPYTPVRIVKQINFDGSAMDMPTYEVEAVDTTGGERHGNYGFTLGEGLTDEGGRIVVSGIAIVMVDALELRKNKAAATRDGSFDSAYYIVPDSTLSNDTDLIAPTGHFKLMSWYVPADFASLLDTDPVFVALDMDQRPSSFLVDVDATIDASSESAGIVTMSSGTAFTYFGKVGSTAAAGDFEVEKDDTAYEVEVFNPFACSASLGEQLIEYSIEYNKFLVIRPQTVKIGKADADIAVDATGTISIWRDGSDTTENEEAKLDWMAGTTQVSAGKEVLITWFADEGIWRITGAECE